MAYAKRRRARSAAPQHASDSKNGCGAAARWWSCEHTPGQRRADASAHVLLVLALARSLYLRSRLARARRAARDKSTHAFAPHSPALMQGGGLPPPQTSGGGMPPPPSGGSALGNAPPTGGVGSLAGGVAAVTLVPSQGVGTGIALSPLLSPPPPPFFLSQPVSAQPAMHCPRRASVRGGLPAGTRHE